MSFKLLAIRPLEGCNKKFLKNLEENRIYKFFNDYSFYNGDKELTGNENDDVTEIKFEQSVPQNLFYQKREVGTDLPINISAIVGKNGSGKSALVELLYVALYNIAVSEKIIDKSKQRTYFKRKIESEFKNLIENEKNQVVDFLNKIIDKFLSHNLNSIVSYENSDDDYISIKSRMMQYIEIFKIIYCSYAVNKQNNFVKTYFDDDFKNDYFNVDNIDRFYSSGTYENRKLNFVDFNIEKKVNAFIDILSDYVYNLNFIESDVFVEFFFLIDKKTIRVSKKKENNSFEFTYYIFEENKNYKFKELNFRDNEIRFSYLFYNLVINYSLYGLNSNETGKWIEKLFHKNDGYQTPIVINPFRNEGIVNINSENELVRDRLLANAIINDKLKQITSNSSIAYLIVKIKKKNEPVHFFYNEIFNKAEYVKFKKQIILFFNSSVSRDKKLKINDFKLSSLDIYCFEYIFKKLKRIAKNYVIYSKYIIDENDTSVNLNNIDSVITLLKELSKDSSHISYKIRQAINFILLSKLNNEDFIYNKFNKNEPFIENGRYEFSKYSELINSKSTEYRIDIINLLPPSIFEIDFEFDNGSKFSMLSSGEKQQIFSTNSILYHLINLNSTKGNKFPLKYPYINLVLDEIELYAHPEMQRNYINQLLIGIKKIDIQNIKALNILFITHSPFILSDIPKQNVLFLEVDSVIKKAIPIDYKGDNTFGENIHQMLTDGFFISNTKGGFVISQINEFLDFYKKNIKLKEKPETIEVELSLYEKLINLVGEDYIRKILNNHLHELYVHFNIQKKFSKEALEKKQLELENELDKIKKQLKNEKD